MKTIKNRVVYVSIISIILFSCNAPTENTSETTTAPPPLPYIGNLDFDYNDNGDIIDTIFHTVPTFAFTAHDSTLITSKNVNGKIYVANFFFTSCPSICPRMTENMKVLHENTADIEEILFLSHTVDPKHDTLERLNNYIDVRNIDVSDNWFFLHSTQEYTYEIGKYGYLINAEVDPEAEGGFLHSEHFVLIDREGRIRGMYDGTKKAKIEDLEVDIRNLIKYEYGE